MASGSVQYSVPSVVAQFHITDQVSFGTNCLNMTQTFELCYIIFMHFKWSQHILYLVDVNGSLRLLLSL